ncbi:gas vesicle protein [Nocardia yunnanensis]|uniref:Gas vesicle protein n=1 Tax=Nocardia yunnanensis TaxID=2382165 RepID=A0A386ZD86_9NOCA|nr:gas vesicle protein [Nocardia yunnanensis]AYF75832.1 gas vesicle protein [Nocardia yunnanensis]
MTTEPDPYLEGELLPFDDDPPAVSGNRDVALIDLLDRVLAGGVVIAGDVTLSIAEVELVRINLRALIVSAAALIGQQPRPDVR